MREQNPAGHVRLPDIDQGMVPCVGRGLVDAWYRQPAAVRAMIAEEFTEAWTSTGPAAAMTSSWWPVLANLSLGEILEEGERTTGTTFPTRGRNRHA